MTDHLDCIVIGACVVGLAIGRALALAGREVVVLEAVKAQAERNGVHDLTFLTANEVDALEPDVACEAALLSPSTGIIDSHALMLSLQGEIEEQGGAVLTHSPVDKVAVTNSGFAMLLDGEEVI